MSQQNHPNSFAVAAAPGVSPERTPDPVAIFSAPDVVFHWWAESKRRWAENNRLSPLMAHPAVFPDPRTLSEPLEQFSLLKPRA